MPQKKNKSSYKQLPQNTNNIFISGFHCPANLWLLYLTALYQCHLTTLYRVAIIDWAPILYGRLNEIGRQTRQIDR